MGQEINISVLLNHHEEVLEFDLEVLPEAFIDEMVNEIAHSAYYSKRGHTLNTQGIQVLHKNGQPITGNTFAASGINSGDQVVLVTAELATSSPPPVIPQGKTSFFKKPVFWGTTIALMLALTASLWLLNQGSTSTSPRLIRQDLSAKTLREFFVEAFTKRKLL